MTELLRKIISESHEQIQNARGSIERDRKFYDVGDFIEVVIGIRRCGKTYTMYQKIHQLLDSGVAHEQILFVNFEDERLYNLDAPQLGKLLDAFYTLYPENHDKKCYLFLDEIQNVQDWQLVVRRFFDSKKCQIYLSGSSAKLLSKEIHTSLRGRSISIEMWPYSFNEYCKAHRIPELKNSLFSSATYDKRLAHLTNYFLCGGFPAVQHIPKEMRSDVLRGYVDTVMLRDVVERHKINNALLLKKLINTLLKNASTPFSIKKFCNDQKSQGSTASPLTISSYLEFLEDAYLIFMAEHYSESDRQRSTLPKKIYAIDSALILLNTISPNSVYGKLFENLVFLDLRREGRKIYHYKTKNGLEVDFVCIAKDNTREIIQVCWDMNDENTLAREKRALEEAQEELKLPGRIITPWEYLRAGLN